MNSIKVIFSKHALKKMNLRLAIYNENNKNNKYKTKKIKEIISDDAKSKNILDDKNDKEYIIHFEEIVIIYHLSKAYIDTINELACKIITVSVINNRLHEYEQISFIHPEHLTIKSIDYYNNKYDSNLTLEELKGLIINDAKHIHVDINEHQLTRSIVENDIKITYTVKDDYTCVAGNSHESRLERRISHIYIYNIKEKEKSYRQRNTYRKDSPIYLKSKNFKKRKKDLYYQDYDY